MTRVVVTALASADTATILRSIASGSGHNSALKFELRFRKFYRRLSEHPESCDARPNLGRDIRVGVVFPYLVIHRSDRKHDTVSNVRVVHGHRRLTRRLLRGG